MLNNYCVFRLRPPARIIHPVTAMRTACMESFKFAGWPYRCHRVDVLVTVEYKHSEDIGDFKAYMCSLLPNSHISTCALHIECKIEWVIQVIRNMLTLIQQADSTFANCCGRNTPSDVTAPTIS
ncbi:unnamed protein product [Dicrocoelium dendriticum]|nr:unnamed protein product [Dicrocoelium dendriticum]